MALKISVDGYSRDELECSCCKASIAFNQPIRAIIGKKGVEEVICSRCRLREGRGEQPKL